MKSELKKSITNIVKDLRINNEKGDMFSGK